jgi:hypothetical protein
MFEQNPNVFRRLNVSTKIAKNCHVLRRLNMLHATSDVVLESGQGLESDSRPIFCGLGLGLGPS